MTTTTRRNDPSARRARGSRAHPGAAPKTGHEFELAVLVDAIRRLTGRAGVFRDRDAAIARARAWVAGHDTSWPLAFDNVCDGLGVDPRRLRARLLNLKRVRIDHLRTRRPLESELVSMIGAGQPLAAVARRLELRVPAVPTLSQRLARCPGPRPSTK
jgi:hypothetical protein